MRITDHKLEGAAFFEAHYIGQVITPEIVVLHDTAGRLEKGNSAAYLASDNPARASVHFVVERDGSISQLVPTNRRANHAGHSLYHGREGCNGFSIGIEIVNPGRMTHVNEQDRGRAWWGEVFTSGTDCTLKYMGTPEHGAGIWMDYTQEQLEAVTALLEVLFRDIPTLKDITTHWYVSPGRKIDTNPLFPLDQVRARVLGPDDPAAAEAEAQSRPCAINGTMVVVEVGEGDTLNMRRWPSFNNNILGAIPDGAAVPVLRSGVFENREWFLVSYGGQDGWVVGHYTAPDVSPEP